MFRLSLELVLDNVHFVFVPPVVVREGNDKQVNMIDVRLLYDVIPMPCQILLLTAKLVEHWFVIDKKDEIALSDTTFFS